MHGIVLVELGALLFNLAQKDQHRGYTTEDLVSGAFVILPGGNEMIDALLEELGVDADICHPGG
jgi:hypothetical protein